MLLPSSLSPRENLLAVGGGGVFVKFNCGKRGITVFFKELVHISSLRGGGLIEKFSGRRKVGRYNQGVGSIELSLLLYR